MKVMKRKTTELPAIYMKLQVLPNMEAFIFSMHNPQSHPQPQNNANIIVKISPVLTVVTQLNMMWHNMTSFLDHSNDLQEHCSTELHCLKKQRHETESAITLLAFISTVALLNIPTTLFIIFALFLLTDFQIWILTSWH